MLLLVVDLPGFERWLPRLPLPPLMIRIRIKISNLKQTRIERDHDLMIWKTTTVEKEKEEMKKTPSKQRNTDLWMSKVILSTFLNKQHITHPFHLFSIFSSHPILKGRRRDDSSFLLFGSSHPLTPLKERDQREKIEGE